MRKQDTRAKKSKADESMVQERGGEDSDKAATRTIPRWVAPVAIACVLVLLSGLFLVAYMNVEKPVPGILTVVGRDGNAVNFTREQLAAMPSTQSRVFLRGSEPGEYEFKGVNVSLLFNTTMNSTSSFRAISSDSYSQTIAGERILDSPFIMVAYIIDGREMDSSKENGYGPFRLIMPPLNGDDFNALLCVKYLSRIVLLQ